MSNWIQLTSGGGYDFETKTIFGPFDAFEDVALPLTCPRYTRHTRLPWPVSLHSVAVARTIKAITGDLTKAAAGLMHDGHEAVIGDITTPVARHIGYSKVQELKEDVQSAIFLKLGIPWSILPERHPEVKLADEAALLVEKQLLMPPAPRGWTYSVPPTAYLQEMYRQVTALLDRVVEPNRRSLLVAPHVADIHDLGAHEFMVEYKNLVVPLVERAS